MSIEDNQPNAEKTSADGSWPVHWIVEAGDQAATEQLAVELAQTLRPGDLLTLGGGLGVGKTTFARTLIRSLCHDSALDVPSPTFTLIQTYETPAFQIVHADLYRIERPQELEALGWSETSADALVLVEWAERAGAPLAPDRLEVNFSMAAQNPECRVISMTGFGAFAARLGQAKAIHQFLGNAGFGSAERIHIQGDASTRAYERLRQPNLLDEDTAILMISPRRPDGPPVRNGLPYSKIARLAEDVRSFVALANGLGSLGFSAPRILAHDLDAGLLLIEDLGKDGIAIDGVPVEERYSEAVHALAHLHHLDLPTELPIADDLVHQIPTYDLEAMLMETELLLDWYLPHQNKHALSASARDSFTDIWKQTLAPLLAAPLTWTQRDYHSPNLMWLPEREGIARIGMLDFQDCVLGPPAYDVVSLLQDARLEVPADMEIRLLSRYVRQRIKADPMFDPATFAKAYAIMGAQRATKILGIFARLNKRDGKPQYLKHLPRIEQNLKRCLAHPVLGNLKGWYETSLPELFE